MMEHEDADCTKMPIAELLSTAVKGWKTQQTSKGYLGLAKTGRLVHSITQIQTKWPSGHPDISNKATDPNRLPGLILLLSTTGLWMKAALLVLCQLFDASSDKGQIHKKKNMWEQMAKNCQTRKRKMQWYFKNQITGSFNYRLMYYKLFSDSTVFLFSKTFLF